jgi:dihydrolipoamide dehydrogenase
LATGARARELKGFEADGKNIWTYKHALTPKEIPKKLLIIGSGAIGMEFASFYNTLGSDTTIIEVLDQILPAEDRDVSSFVKKQFEKQGIKIFDNSKAMGLKREKGGFNVEINTSGKINHIACDTIISAVGIVGNIEDLGFDALKVEVKDSHVVVDEFCKTNIEGIFAIGDLAGAPWLAHKASHEGVMVAEIIAGKSPHPINYRDIAGCTYCYPQIASVGITEEEAKKNGREIKVGRFPFIANGKALALGEHEGMIKTIFDSKSGELIGAHMVGPEVTELIQGYIIGRKLETTEEDLINTIFPHPTLSESMHESVLNAFDRAIHI